jgi:hypothetical protein
MLKTTRRHNPAKSRRASGATLRIRSAVSGSDMRSASPKTAESLCWHTFWPNNWKGIVFCNNTGVFATTFKTAAGAGIVVAQTKRAILYSNGTDVVRVTADA